MIFQIEILDDSPELEELDFVIAKINKENPKTLITPEQYLQNIVIGHFQQRVKQLYIGHAEKQSVGILKESFGSLLDIRR